jgi:beta-glucanase (GH16 family)
MTRNIALVYLVFCSSIVTMEVSADTTDPDAYAWSEAHRGEPLDLKGYVLTFSDQFDQSKITDETGDGVWFAPVHTDVGASTWDRPGPQNDTYSVKNGLLRIRARQAVDGKWHAGSIQTVNRNGRGFAQQYGYFEARIKFPAMPGAWCAFWLKSQTEYFDPAIVRPEIDVVEWYGGDPKGHHQTVHLWPPGQQYITPGGLAKHWHRSNYTGLPELASGWHTHGVVITPEWVIMYVDRIEVARFPTFVEFKHPLYPLVSLTLYDKDLAKAVSPFDMQVDYVRIYAARVPKPPVLHDAQ